MADETGSELEFSGKPPSKDTCLENEFRFGKQVLKLKEGNIGNYEGEAFFVLNLKDNRFPAPGPVFESIVERDETLKREGIKGREIYNLILEHAKTIPDSSLIKERGSLSGEVFEIAEFQSRPYQTEVVDVTSANWPHLKKVIFGNIGPEGEGILVRIWQPIASQTPKLLSELTTLLNKAFDTARETNTQSVAMPILTGHRAPANLFFQALADVVKKRPLPCDITVYAYTPKDYKIGQKTLTEKLSKK